MGAATQFKQAIAKQLATLTAWPESQLVSLLRAPKQRADGHFTLPLAKLTGGQQDGRPLVPWCRDLAAQFQGDALIDRASCRGAHLNFHARPAEFSRCVLQQIHRERDQYGWTRSSAMPAKKPTVVIDYSSPNIAKPFHAGHLRSTILGNFIKRIHAAMGYNVVGINYLGDWGKQYGLLAVGFERYGDEEMLAKDPIHHLYEVYVKINVDAAVQPDVDRRANAYFERMEKGDATALAQWRRFRSLSIDSYASIYARLGVTFDEYSGESQVNAYIPQVHAILNERGLTTRADDGAVVLNLERYGLGMPVVQRTDGTSLYLTRDLATLLMRREQHAFDRAIYVVGTEQTNYFCQLFKAAELMGLSETLMHCHFGRIQGMSTRKGTVVFLQDILDTAKDRILAYMRDNDTKQALLEEGENEGLASQQYVDDMGHQTVNTEPYRDIADRLGVSAILVQDMKARRAKNYAFAWDRMTDARGDTGVFLQYAHARACGIERKNATVPIHAEVNFELLQEPEALELVETLSYFPELVSASFDTLEPCTLVNYLFKLSHATSLASHVLRVKGSDPDLAAARMSLFWAARTTLSNGMTLLGIQPLEQM